MLTARRDKRLYKELTDRIKSRCNTMVSVVNIYMCTRPIAEANPRAVDLYFSRDFYSVIHETPADTEVTVATFSDAVANLPQICERWRRIKLMELLAMLSNEPRELLPGRLVRSEPLKAKKRGKKTSAVPPSIPAEIKFLDDVVVPEDLDTRPLELATTFFECRNCSEPLSYPRVLVHDCAYMSAEAFQSADRLLKHAIDTLWCTPWDYDGTMIRGVSALAHEGVYNILSCLGLAKDTSFAQLESLDPRVECVTCGLGGTRAKRGPRIFSWKVAVSG